jgi:hypothetical protein
VLMWICREVWRSPCCRRLLRLPIRTTPAHPTRWDLFRSPSRNAQQLQGLLFAGRCLLRRLSWSMDPGLWNMETHRRRLAYQSSGAPTL